VIRISGRPRADIRMLAAVAVAGAAVSLAACSAPGSAPAAPAAPATHAAAAPAAASQAPGTGSPAAASPAAASPAAASPAGGGAAAPGGQLPDYQPSTVVSKSASSTVLTSPDPVDKIGAFYKNALAQGGWHVTSSSMSAYHASFTASRSSEGASISVYSRGSGSGISISTHPM
jgi:hypothetical protein